MYIKYYITFATFKRTLKENGRTIGLNCVNNYVVIIVVRLPAIVDRKISHSLNQIKTYYLITF